MANLRAHAFRGIARLASFLLIFVLTIIAFNVVGYHLNQHDLVFIGEPNNWPSTYFGRALLLSLIGVLQFAVCSVIVGLVAAVLALAYHWILWLGGYPEGKDVEC